MDGTGRFDEVNVVVSGEDKDKFINHVQALTAAIEATSKEIATNKSISIKTIDQAIDNVAQRLKGYDLKKHKQEIKAILANALKATATQEIPSANAQGASGRNNTLYEAIKRGV
ncbi:MAG: hypothetical protein R3D71_06425 [Rickettsiales bacterium]